jgi:23S rRNA G2445 N2-methylase RlmL
MSCLIISRLVYKRVAEFHYTITGDKAPSAVQKAKDNVKNANLETNTSKSKKETFDTEKNDRREATHGFNPPYDCLDIHMEEFYKNIGDTLKKTILERILGLLQKFRSIEICWTYLSQKLNNEYRSAFSKIRNVRGK